MLRTILFALTLTVAGASYAQSNDPYDDCDQKIIPQATVQGCSFLIENSSALGMDKYDLATTYIDRGRALATLGEYRLAANDYSQAIQIEPSNGELFFHRGNMQKAQNLFEAALQDYMRANQLGYQEAQLFMNVGNTFSALGDFEEAIRLLSIAVEADPKSFAAFYNRGLVNAKAGNRGAASRDFRQALDLAPRTPQGLLVSGLIHRTNQDFDRAYQAWEAALSLGGPQLVLELQLRASQARHYSGNLDGKVSPEFEAALQRCVRDPDC